MIPIIPFINPSNANDQLSKLITNANLQGVLSPDFTSDVVTFIDDIDMRLLINIFQEYQIYKNVLSPSLKQDNLFAILVYKNMHPDDFGDLSKRKGKLYKFLTDKQAYVSDLKEDLKVQIRVIEDRLALLDGEVSSNIRELRAVYTHRLISKLPGFQSFHLSKDVTLLEAIEDEFFNQLKFAADITYSKFEFQAGYNRYYLSSAVSSGIKFSSIEKIVSSELSYEQREKLLLDRAKNQINVLKADKEKIRNRIGELDSMSIQEIFRLIDIGNYLGEFKDSYLMRNLLLNGYLDEHFDDYISLFHEVSLTKDDFSFERSVKGGVSLQFDYQLTKTDNLIKRLQEKYFKREAILNYFLLDCLLVNENKFKSKSNAFYEGLAVAGDKQFQFINGFIKKNPSRIAQFIKNLSVNKPGLWSYINTKSGLPDEEIRNLIRLIFEYADMSSILELEDVEALIKYIEDLPDAFAFFSSFKNLTNIKEFISGFSLLFKNLDLPVEEQNSIFKFIYTKNYYQINQHNILAIIKANNKDYDVEELNRANYTTILKLGLNPLQDYISSNIEKYISDVMTFGKENVDEAEETIITILNREDVSLSLKNKILETQEMEIQSLHEISDIEVKQIALSNNSIVRNWKNVFDYYDAAAKEDFDDVLVSFLSDPINYDFLSQEQLNHNSSKDEEYIKKISGKLLHFHELPLDTFTEILKSLPYVYRIIRYDEFDAQRIEKLLDKNILTLSPENFTGLKAKSTHLSIRLIEIHQKNFIEKFSELPLEASDWLLVFKSSVVTQQNKLLLVQKIDDSLIVSNSEIADAVGNLLLVNALIPVRYEVLDAIFNSNPSVQKRIGLLNLNFSNLDDVQIKSLIEKLGEDYIKIFMKQHKPMFPNQNFNVELFKKLQERDLIIRYELEDKDKSIRVIAKYQ